jgi:hypothetical protein
MKMDASESESKNATAPERDSGAVAQRRTVRD